jgi:hypothetical protein
MKAFAFALLGAASLALPTVNVADFIESTFDNMVDHFDFQDGRTYK